MEVTSIQHYGDITQLSGYTLPVVDVITFGAPCTDLSIAGSRKGLLHMARGDNETSRSGLFYDALRVIKEMRERDSNSPRFAVYENVKGAFSSHGGRDWQSVLTEICRIADPTVPDVPLPKKGKWPRAGCIMGVRANGQPFSVGWRLHNAVFWGTPQRRERIALVADFGGVASSEILFERQGVSGNLESHRQRKETSDPPESQRRIDASGATHLNNTMLSFQERAGKPGGGKGMLIQYDHMGAIATCNIQKILDDRPHISAVSIGNGQRHNISMSEHANTLDTMHDQQAVSITVGNDVGKIRRLTPIEAERLQGMPDDWSKYGIKPDGNVYELATTVRFKLQGNGIATPFWRWMLRRLANEFTYTPTLGSLFDGQSSYPMLWKEINGKGTAIWASEIDPQAVAVSKYHFPDEKG